MIVEIKKEDIPEWDLGDVAIKTFSFGESLKLASFIKTVKQSKIQNPDGTESVVEDLEYKDGINLDDVGMFSLAAGIHYIREKNGESFHIKPMSPVEERIKKMYLIEKNSGVYLSRRISDTNKNRDGDEKKK